jgi:alkaline phosphatase
MLKRIPRKAYRWSILSAIALFIAITITPVFSRSAPNQQRNMILMIGDGMGWEITRAAAIQKAIDRGNTGKTLKDFYIQGRGSGLKMQTLKGYALATTYGTIIADSTGKYSGNHSALD